ncbi:MAG: SDR family NAD(P)-dependent oxidoreductase [Alistipes sp.]
MEIDWRASKPLRSWEAGARRAAIDVVINNAGIFSFCDILATPAERIERIILLHDLTVTQLCRLFAADMVRRGVRGHILNMSSYSLWMPFPGLALYSASKAYMRSFSVASPRGARAASASRRFVRRVATDLYGLTPRWQRIGTARRAYHARLRAAGTAALWRAPVHRARLVEPGGFPARLPMWVLRPIRRFTMRFQK